MHCERARELLSPYLDGELSPRRAVAAWRPTSRSATGVPGSATDFRRIGRTIAEAAREPAPHTLAPRVRAALVQATAAEGEGALLLRCQARRGRLGTGPPADAPSRSAGCGLCAHRLGHVVGRERVRSAEKAGAGGGVGPYPLASAGERRSRSPPPTCTPSSRGLRAASTSRPRSRISRARASCCSAVGVDYVGGRRVGVLVYKRRQHTDQRVRVAERAERSTPPRSMAQKGYNLIDMEPQRPRPAGRSPTSTPGSCVSCKS